MSNRKLHKLSVVVPAFRQKKTIVRDIMRLEKTLKNIRYPYEIIVVVDGFGDGTDKAIRRIASPDVKILVYLKNQGKGHAVRLGMTKATGDYIAFIDAGMEIDPNGISILLEHLEWYDADIIVGSKRHPASIVKYPLGRKFLSRGYQLLVFLLFRLNVRDTQAGIKIFKRKVLQKMLPRLVVKRYAFDLEMLVVAHHLGFRRIYEAPIKLKYNFNDLAHASTLKTVYAILLDTLAIFYRLYILKFYQNRRKSVRISP